MVDIIENHLLHLIRPNTDKLLGAYLNAVLHTKLATRYFELNASGSGQLATSPLCNLYLQISLFVAVATISFGSSRKVIAQL